MSQHASEPAGPSYYLIFGALVVLTALTVGVAYVDLGRIPGIIAAMAIAATKATLVVLFFMHLKTEIKPMYIVVAVPIVLVAIMLVIFGWDIGLVR